MQVIVCVCCYVVFSLLILFLLHGLSVGDNDEMSKYSRVHVKSCTSALIREALGSSSASASKKMAENFTLFAIEEEIALQMPKNSAKRAKIQLDE